MEFLTELWLPIVLSAVFVFVASSVIHMLLPVHRGDWAKLPAEDELLEAMRERGVEPGQYMFPCPASMKEMASPEMIEKYKAGPVGHMVVGPNGPPAIGKSLIQWFALSLVIGVFVAYLTRAAHGPTTDYLAIFRMAGTAAVLGYAFSSVQDSIWKGVSWKTTAKFVGDGVVYGLVTAGTFAWLWPHA